MMEYDAPKPRRATNASVATAREAREAVREVREKVGNWQSTASRLRTEYAYFTALTDKQRTANKAAELLVEIKPSVAELEGLEGTLPNHVASSSHFQDVLRALHSIVGTLEIFAGTPHR